MDLEELGYYLFMLEEEERQKQLEKTKEIHNETKSDLETELASYNSFTGK